MPNIIFNNYERVMINNAKTLAILLVLLIHSDLRHAVEGNYLTDIYMQFFSSIFSAPAVPIFFTISGYLFFNDFNYKKKIKSRIKSLLIPYVLVCTWGFLIIIFFQGVLGLENLFTGTELKLLRDFSGIDYLRIFWDIRNGAPIISVLWFLRDLIVLVFISPIIYFFIRRTGYFFIIFLFIFNTLSGFTLFSVSSVSLFYFSLGGFFINKGIRVNDIIFFKFKRFLIFCWSISLLLCLVVYLLYPDLENILLNFYIVLSVPCIFIFCKSQRVQNSKCLYQLSPIGFFLYLMHEPWMGYLQKVFYKIVYLPEWTQVITFWFFPFVVLACCFYCYKGLNKLSPNFLALLIGKRKMIK